MHPLARRCADDGRMSHESIRCVEPGFCDVCVVYVNARHSALKALECSCMYRCDFVDVRTTHQQIGGYQLYNSKQTTYKYCAVGQGFCSRMKWDVRVRVTLPICVCVCFTTEYLNELWVFEYNGKARALWAVVRRQHESVLVQRTVLNHLRKMNCHAGKYKQALATIALIERNCQHIPK
jgi:hypothetical protein